jgi:hypothetical protein
MMLILRVGSRLLVIALAIALPAGPACGAPEAGVFSDECLATALEARESYTRAGFATPDLNLRVDVLDYMVFLHNYGHVDADDYIIVLDRSTLGNADLRRFVVYHEVFHYIQRAYLSLDPSLDCWLVEPSATAMAGIAGGVPMPVPRPPLARDVFADERIACHFWRYLLGEDPEVVMAFLEANRDGTPTITGFKRWLEKRYGRSLDTITVRFTKWYESGAIPAARDAW